MHSSKRFKLNCLCGVRRKSDGAGIPAEVRGPREVDLRAGLLEIEREEEALITLAAVAGRPIARRRDADACGPRDRKLQGANRSSSGTVFPRIGGR